jgi:hypothetical protein
VAAVRLLVGPHATPRNGLRIVLFALSAGLTVGVPSAFVARATAAGSSSSSATATPSGGIVIVPLTGGGVATTPPRTTQFPTTSPSNNTCTASGSPTSPSPSGGTTTSPAGGGGGGGTTSPPNGVGGVSTTSPSVSPSVLGITFDNPPPNTSPNQGGGLPFTGLPLTHLLAMASGLIGAGLLLVRSKRRHYLGGRYAARHLAG